MNYDLKAIHDAEYERDYSGIPHTLTQWAERELPPRIYLLGHVFTKTTRAMLSAATGIGKTHVGHAIGLAMAAGESFCHWAGRDPSRVLVIDGEMSRDLTQERLADAVRRLGYHPDTFHLLCKEDCEDLPPLDTPDGQAWVDGFIDYLGGIDFLILDNVMSLVAGDLKDEEAWKPVKPWQLSLTRREIGLLWINHTGHDATKSYGTKTREWDLDLSMIGERIEHDTQADIALRVTFSKARGRTPDTRDDFEPFELRLVGNEWTSTAAPKKRNMPKNANTAMSTLREAIDNVGETVPAMPSVQAGAIGVTRNQWRDYFYRRSPLAVDRDDDALELKRAKEARKKDFQRCVRALQEAGVVQCMAEWYWMVN